MPDSRFPFSNFLPWECMVGNITFPTLEHAYQGMKTKDLGTRFLISQCVGPGAAKRMGGRIALRPDWEEIKFAVMTKLIEKKFAFNSAYGNQLEQFEGDIVEWNTWHDQIWGVCTCPRHNGNGNNHLGRILSQRRTQLRKMRTEL